MLRITLNKQLFNGEKCYEKIPILLILKKCYSSLLKLNCLNFILCLYYITNAVYMKHICVPEFC